MSASKRFDLPLPFLTDEDVEKTGTLESPGKVPQILILVDEERISDAPLVTNMRQHGV